MKIIDENKENEKGEKEVILIRVGKEYYPTNCYVVKDSNGLCCIIDPGFDFDKIVKTIEDNNLIVDKVILTHCHADHIGELEKVVNKYNCDVFIHENDYDGIFDDEKAHFTKLRINKLSSKVLSKIVKCKNGDYINVGDIKFEVIHTPGHTDGCICLYEKDMNILLTGDTVFKDCYGRCDLKSGSIEDMIYSINLLFDRFSNIVIYPGHEDVVNIDDIKKKIKLLLAFR